MDKAGRIQTSISKDKGQRMLSEGSLLSLGSLFFLLSVFLFLCVVNIAVAQSPPDPDESDTPKVYRVTVNMIRISSDGGSTWTTVKDTDSTFDIASVDAGAAVGNFFSGTLTPGTYNRIEHRAKATFRMKGYVYYSVPDRTYYTDPNGTNGTSSVAGNVTDTSQMPGYDEADIVVYGYSEGDTLPAEEEAVNIVIERGKTQKLNIDFDVSGTLGLYDQGGYQLMPTPPTVTVSVE